MLLRTQIQTKEYFILILASPQDLLKKKSMLQDFIPILNLKRDIGWAYVASQEFPDRQEHTSKSIAYFYHNSRLILSTPLSSIDSFKQDLTEILIAPSVLEKPPASN